MSALGGARLECVGTATESYAVRRVLAEFERPCSGRRIAPAEEKMSIISRSMTALQRKPADVQINKERVQHWLSKGARPSDSVRTLLEKHLSKDLSAPVETPAAQ